MAGRLRDDVALAGAALALAAAQSGVISRRQLYALGVTRWQVRAELRSGRWQRVGDQSVCTHNSILSTDAHRWAAVFQGGPRAMLDGATALAASGLRRFADEGARVSVPRGARVRRSADYNIRQTRRWAAGDDVGAGVPRTRPAVAAVRGALWARTDREATYLLTLVVQQGLARPEDIGHELLRIRRAARRLLVHAVVNELLDGARALGELDVLRVLARHGLPAPERQVLRRDSHNRYYLDLYWPEYRLVVEVDGIHHAWAENVVGDALRQNRLTLDGDRVLRIPLLGLRLCPEEFVAQVRDALAAAGWRHAA